MTISFVEPRTGNSHPPPDKTEASVVFQVSEPIAPGVSIPVCSPCTPYLHITELFSPLNFKLDLRNNLAGKAIFVWVARN